MRGSQRFDGGNWTSLATGAPVLADCLAAFDCLVEEVIERHSHAIVLGAVVSLREGGDEPGLADCGANSGPRAEACRSGRNDCGTADPLGERNTLFQLFK